MGWKWSEGSLSTADWLAACDGQRVCLSPWFLPDWRSTGVSISVVSTQLMVNGCFYFCGFYPSDGQRVCLSLWFLPVWRSTGVFISVVSTRLMVNGCVYLCGFYPSDGQRVCLSLWFLPDRLSTDVSISVVSTRLTVNGCLYLCDFYPTYLTSSDSSIRIIPTGKTAIVFWPGVGEIDIYILCDFVLRLALTTTDLVYTIFKCMWSCFVTISYDNKTGDYDPEIFVIPSQCCWRFFPFFFFFFFQTITNLTSTTFKFFCNLVSQESATRTKTMKTWSFSFIYVYIVYVGGLCQRRTPNGHEKEIGFVILRWKSLLITPDCAPLCE